MIKLGGGSVDVPYVAHFLCLKYSMCDKNDTRSPLLYDLFQSSHRGGMLEISQKSGAVQSFPISVDGNFGKLILLRCRVIWVMGKAEKISETLVHFQDPEDFFSEKHATYSLFYHIYSNFYFL